MGSLRVLVLPWCVWAAALGSAARAAGLDPLGPIGPGRARVFSLDAGGSIPARPLGGGRPIQLLDGEVVRFGRTILGRDMTDARALVFARGQQVLVPNEQVITADRGSRSPDGEWAILVVPQSCDGATCHAVGWLLSQGLRRYFSSYMN